MWDQRVCDSVVFARAVGSPSAQAGAETLAIFTLRLAEAVPDEFCADVLHAQATCLCDFSPGMRAAAAFEALEDGSASPPHIGGALVQQLTHEGSLFVGTVGLREDLKSVRAIMKDPLWNVPGGWTSWPLAR